MLGKWGPVLTPTTQRSIVEGEVGLEAGVDKDKTHPPDTAGPLPNTRATATARPGPVQCHAVQPQRPALSP